jgi:hypothetical protein
MPSKPLALWSKLKPYLAKLYACSPFACGLGLGYFGHPFIKLAIDALLKLLHLL